MKSSQKLRGRKSGTHNETISFESESVNDGSGSELSESDAPEVKYPDPRFQISKVSKEKLQPIKQRTIDVEEKKTKPGVIYLSTIPPKMNVTRVREYFSQFGDINRSFLQPEDKPWKGKRKVKNQTFTEGWIEFKKRKHAKKVTEMLNNQPVGGKKSKAYHDHLWNIKYLQGFQWVHLNERLAYERISRQQKLRNEISAAKRESSFFAKNVDLSKKLKKKGILNKPPRKFTNEKTIDRLNDSGSDNIETSLATQGDTNSNVAEIMEASSIDKTVLSGRKRKHVGEGQGKDRSKFLKSIFGK